MKRSRAHWVALVGIAVIAAFVGWTVADAAIYLITNEGASACPYPGGL